MVGTSRRHLCHNIVTWYLRDRAAHPLHGLPPISKALGLALPHVWSRFDKYRPPKCLIYIYILTFNIGAKSLIFHDFSG